MSEAFPKLERLVTQKDFQFMKTESFRMREDSVLMVYKRSRIENLQFNRLGLIVSKKNGNAVRRNKIKRALRELYRKSELKTFDGPFDFLLVANVPKEKEASEITDYLTQIFSSLVKRFKKKNDK